MMEDFGVAMLLQAANATESGTQEAYDDILQSYDLDCGYKHVATLCD